LYLLPPSVISSNLSFLPLVYISIFIATTCSLTLSSFPSFYPINQKQIELKIFFSLSQRCTLGLLSPGYGIASLDGWFKTFLANVRVIFSAIQSPMKVGALLPAKQEEREKSKEFGLLALKLFDSPDVT